LRASSGLTSVDGDAELASGSMDCISETLEQLDEVVVTVVANVGRS
jgi:hypothetical protein